MKVILSRKGTDSSFGGFPSIILPDNTLLSFPIPGDEDEVCYSEVETGLGMKMSDIISDITDRVYYYQWKKFDQHTHCHLDPDLVYEALPRKTGWRGCFGQADAAQTVLEKHHVGKGDLFLFFGWFRRCALREGKYVLEKKGDMHCIYGYLQIGDVIHTSNTAMLSDGQQVFSEAYPKFPDWLVYHPHALKRRMGRNSNCIYVARETLSWDKSVKGYGLLPYNTLTTLTKLGYSRSRWDLPSNLRGKSITYHSDLSWKEDYFQSACRGQEFILEETPEVEAWAQQVISSVENV